MNKPTHFRLKDQSGPLLAGTVVTAEQAETDFWASRADLEPCEAPPEETNTDAAGASAAAAGDAEAPKKTGKKK
jgi:hypothetical protein